MQDLQFVINTNNYLPESSALDKRKRLVGGPAWVHGKHDRQIILGKFKVTVIPCCSKASTLFSSSNFSFFSSSI